MFPALTLSPPRAECLYGTGGGQREQSSLEGMVLAVLQDLRTPFLPYYQATTLATHI